jgi:type I site-specific restriction endonuclease
MAGTIVAHRSVIAEQAAIFAYIDDERLLIIATLAAPR